MKKKKLLLLGSTGMAGHLAYYYLIKSGKYEITNVVYRNKLTSDSIVMDLSNKIECEKLIYDLRPDIILNCVGILIKGSQTQPDNAIYINAYLPHLLERLASDVKAKLVHISTDCVFSGKKGNYDENNERDADDIYGKSKGLGEIINNKDLTIRTSIIGPELKENGEGIFHWFLNQKGIIKGYTDAYWSGITTLELAKAIEIAIDQNLTGLVHLTNGEKISKYHLLLLIKEIWNKKEINIFPENTKSVDKSLKKSEIFKYDVPSYSKMLEELRQWIHLNSVLYSSEYI